MSVRCNISAFCEAIARLCGAENVWIGEAGREKAAAPGLVWGKPEAAFAVATVDLDRFEALWGWAPMRGEGLSNYLNRNVSWRLNGSIGAFLGQISNLSGQAGTEIALMLEEGVNTPFTCLAFVGRV